MSELIQRVRKNIAEAGGSEALALSTDASIKQLWADKQELIQEMNQAKKAAAEEAAKPYLDLIEEINKQYAFLLQMIGDNGDE